MENSDHGVVKDDKAQEQPKDKKRAQKAEQSDPDKSASHEGTGTPARKHKE